MSTNIRPEISKQSKYWISKHCFYELKHYCLQYPEWKKIYAVLETRSLPKGGCMDYIARTNTVSNPTEDIASLKAEYSKKIDLIETIAEQTDPELQEYIIKAVTQGTSYTYMETVLHIPCSRDTFYERYRRFFWLLSQNRG